VSAAPSGGGAGAPGDRASVTISVAVAPELAFALFTEEIDRWWRRGPRFRNAPGERGFIRIEPGVGGRVFESFGDGQGERVVEIGRTLAWDPPRCCASRGARRTSRRTNPPRSRCASRRAARERA
jgi:hypothetical protein